MSHSQSALISLVFSTSTETTAAYSVVHPTTVKMGTTCVMELAIKCAFQALREVTVMSVYLISMESTVACSAVQSIATRRVTIHVTVLATKCVWKATRVVGMVTATSAFLLTDAVSQSHSSVMLHVFIHWYWKISRVSLRRIGTSDTTGNRRVIFLIYTQCMQALGGG